MTTQQLFEAYLAECAKNDAGRMGASLTEQSPREQELYVAWQAALRECVTWRDGETTWQVLSKYQDGDLEMWTCRIEQVGKPAEIADCYASYIREAAQPID